MTWMFNDRVRADHPSGNLRGYVIRDSSNIKYVAWTKEGNMLVWFKGGGLYRYDEVPRQRVVAMCLAQSVGRYFHKNIKNKFFAVKLA